MFYFDSAARYSELGPGGHMRLTAVLDLLQDCCTFHSESAGAGLSYLREMNRTWVLASWQVVICRYPVLGEKLRTCTWPYAFRGFVGNRSFRIEDENGETVAYADSIWTFLDTKRGAPARIPPEITDKYRLSEPYNMERKGRKITVAEDLAPQDPVRIGRSFIDTNHHVNNAKYVRMAEEYLPEGFQTAQLRAEYKKPAVLGDVVYPKAGMSERRAVVSLEDGEGKPYAVIEFERE